MHCLHDPVQAETAKVNRGVVHRNCALDYIQDRRLNGIMYFMDDDNTYMPQVPHEPLPCLHGPSPDAELVLSLAHQ